MVNVKTLGDAIGMPDEEDKAFIRALILEYDRNYPGEIKGYRDKGRAVLSEHGSWHGRQEYGVTGRQASWRWFFALPPRLHAAIEKYYPTIFRDKKHFHWFVKNFKELMLPEKY